jgi:hypothetical protein
MIPFSKLNWSVTYVPGLKCYQRSRSVPATAHNPAAGVSPSPHVPPINRSFLASAFRPTVPHIIMQTPGLAGSSLAGRTLDSYRSAPVRFAFRAP